MKSPEFRSAPGGGKAEQKEKKENPVEAAERSIIDDRNAIAQLNANLELMRERLEVADEAERKTIIAEMRKHTLRIEELTAQVESNFKNLENV